MNFGDVTYEALGVRRLRVEDHLVCLAGFHKFPVLHDIDGVGDVIGKADIMGDEDDGHAGLVPQIEQHVEDRGARAGVDHAGGLVGQLNLRLEQEGAGDHEPLHLSAGELEGILESPCVPSLYSFSYTSRNLSTPSRQR